MDSALGLMLGPTRCVIGSKRARLYQEAGHDVWTCLSAGMQCLFHCAAEDERELFLPSRWRRGAGSPTGQLKSSCRPADVHSGSPSRSG